MVMNWGAASAGGTYAYSMSCAPVWSLRGDVVGGRERRTWCRHESLTIFLSSPQPPAALARMQNADEQTGDRRWQWCGRTGTLQSPRL